MEEEEEEEMTVELFMNKLEKGLFTEDELSAICQEDWSYSWEELPEDFLNSFEWIPSPFLERDYRKVRTVFAIQDRYYAIDWEEGCGKHSENGYPNQPFEVKKITKMVEVNEYEGI